MLESYSWTPGKICAISGRLEGDNALRKKILVSLISVVFVFIMTDLLLSTQWLSVSRYSYHNEKVSKPLTIVQLSDLHNVTFGKENQRLLAKIRKANPDLIFMTGDMLNDNEQRTDVVLELVQEAVQIAPVYYSLGNHEVEYTRTYDEQETFYQELSRAGAVVLDKEYVDTTIAGQEVRIGGVYGYVLDYDWQDGSEQRFMEAFQDTDRFKILLSHIPEGLLLWKSMEYWDVDLVFSGHVHGGQVRLPFVGGLYDPEEGWFPTYTKGMYACGKGTMILSAGLGSAGKIPRFNNLPEVVVCKVEPKIES